jgi:uncharacterized small protein (DUF1192 family)
MTGNDAILTLLGELRLRIAVLEAENAELRASLPTPDFNEGTPESYLASVP